MKKKKNTFNLLNSKVFLLAFFPAFIVVATSMIFMGLNSINAFKTEALTTLRTTTVTISADGYYKEWQPYNSATTTLPTNHYTLVDESLCNKGTDYVYSTSTTPENTDSYTVRLNNIPNGSTIKKISIQPCASTIENAGTATSTGITYTSSTLSVFYKYNGTDSSAKTHSLQKNTFVTLAASLWNGLNITKNASSTLEVGILHLEGSAGLRVSNIKTLITY